MIERVEQRFDLKPQRLVGDTAYGAAPMLNWIVNEKRIEPHIPVWEKSQREDGTLSAARLRVSTNEANKYECPGGKPFEAIGASSRTRATGAPRPTRSSTVPARDCAHCPLKQQLLPEHADRKIARSIYESARDVARTVCTTPAYERSRKDRKKVEMLFAHLKRILKLDRLRLRGSTERETSS